MALSGNCSRYYSREQGAAVPNSFPEVVELNVDQSRLYALVETLLTDREREIMILRYGLYAKRPLTQREVASRLGISRSYVSRIEKAALEKLRESF
jgi:RNA polymerase sporulation-specific sigma factor